MNGWTIFYWGWWISWGPFVGTFLARISKGRKLGNVIMASLIIPSLWSFFFMGVFGAAQIRIQNMAVSAGLTSAMPYGSLADKSSIGYNVPNHYGGGTHWVGVADGTVKLSALGTENVLFEHLQAYGGEGYGTFMSVITLVCIVLYFVTSSDSASYVVDIIAANGIEKPPVTQKVFWAFTEGAAAIALLASGGDDNSTAAINAVKALPIVLGLPFTFLMFWMCQSLIIACQEEVGQKKLDRKNFSTFLLNMEPMSWVAMVCPFVPLGQVASKTWGGSAALYMSFYGAAWFTMVILLICQAGDYAFGYMAAATYCMLALGVAGLRVAVREKLGITGDMVSDVCASTFAFPWAIGQMAVEDFDAVPMKSVAQEEKVPDTDTKVEPATQGI
jgi:hypothetical protein